MVIRQEQEQDFAAVRRVIIQAFANDPHGDQTEHLLVERLRKSDAFIPELSLVAEVQGKVVGHILLTRIHIRNKTESHPSLALAPVSVLPAYQGKGIGGQLIEESHKRAQKLGFKSIVLLGHETYYPRFGYRQTDEFGIQLPFNAPPENCMVVELVPDGLEGVSGMVEYSEAFFK